MVLFIAGVFIWLTGLFFTVKKINPNHFCGFVNRWTLGDRFVWETVNRYCGECMLFWGGLLLVAHSLPAQTALWWIVIPAIFLSASSVLGSALLYHHRWKTWSVSSVTTNSGSDSSYLAAELLIPAIPLVFVYLLLSGKLTVPCFIPGAFSLSGKVLVMGTGADLLKVFVLGEIIAVAFFIRARTMCYPTSAARWAFYILRIGLVLLVVAYGLSMLLVQRQVVSSPWPVISLPLILVFIGGFSMVRIASSVPPVCYCVWEDSSSGSGPCPGDSPEEDDDSAEAADGDKCES